MDRVPEPPEASHQYGAEYKPEINADVGELKSLQMEYATAISSQCAEDRGVVCDMASITMPSDVPTYCQQSFPVPISASITENSRTVSESLIWSELTSYPVGYSADGNLVSGQTDGQTYVPDSSPYGCYSANMVRVDIRPDIDPTVSNQYYDNRHPMTSYHRVNQEAPADGVTFSYTDCPFGSAAICLHGDRNACPDYHQSPYDKCTTSQTVNACSYPMGNGVIFPDNHSLEEETGSASEPSAGNLKSKINNNFVYNNRQSFCTHVIVSVYQGSL